MNFNRYPTAVSLSRNINGKMRAFQPEHLSHAPWAAFRWQIVPATLSVALGTILFVVNVVHLHDAMLPEIGRAFDPTLHFGIAHGIMCIIASTLFFGASACGFLAARKSITSEYQTALALNICIPLLFSVGAFLMYAQV